MVEAPLACAGTDVPGSRIGKAGSAGGGSITGALGWSISGGVCGNGGVVGWGISMGMPGGVPGVGWGGTENCRVISIFLSWLARLVYSGLVLHQLIYERRALRLAPPRHHTPASALELVASQAGLEQSHQQTTGHSRENR